MLFFFTLRWYEPLPTHCTGFWLHILYSAARVTGQALPTRGTRGARWTRGKGGFWGGLEGESAGAVWRSEVS